MSQPVYVTVHPIALSHGSLTFSTLEHLFHFQLLSHYLLRVPCVCSVLSHRGSRVRNFLSLSSVASHGSGIGCRRTKINRRFVTSFTRPRKDKCRMVQYRGGVPGGSWSAMYPDVPPLCGVPSVLRYYAYFKNRPVPRSRSKNGRALWHMKSVAYPAAFFYLLVGLSAKIQLQRGGLSKTWFVHRQSGETRVPWLHSDRSMTATKPYTLKNTKEGFAGSRSLWTLRCVCPIGPYKHNDR